MKAREEWVEEYLRPNTGLGRFDAEEAGYFAEITACDQQPELVGLEFTWGV